MKYQKIKSKEFIRLIRMTRKFSEQIRDSNVRAKQDRTEGPHP